MIKHYKFRARVVKIWKHTLTAKGFDTHCLLMLLGSSVGFNISPQSSESCIANSSIELNTPDDECPFVGARRGTTDWRCPSRSARWVLLVWKCLLTSAEAPRILAMFLVLPSLHHQSNHRPSETFNLVQDSRMPPPTALDLLSDYTHHKADDLDLGKYSLKNALALASGSLPLVVLLQEPCNTADTLPYAKLVYGDRRAREGSSKHRGSPTLQEVDRHVRRASDSEHDLQDVRVYELNPLLSPNVLCGLPKREQADERRLAQSTTWKMIKAEPPKVILVLTTGAGRSDVRGMRQFQSSLDSAGSMETVDIRGEECLVIYGFHPSVYLRDDYVSKRGWSPRDVARARGVLRFCFEQAFAHLEGQDVTLMSGKMREYWEKVLEPKKLFRKRSGMGSLEAALGSLTI